MATRYYTFVENEFYHVFNRGNSKQSIFKSEKDFEHFERLLYITNTTERIRFGGLGGVDVYGIERADPLVHIGAYCLMHNHFHLLITPAQEGGIPKFMLKLGTAHASYFNQKYERTGALFEGSYKAKFAESDRYLRYLFAYIHLNPFHKEDSKPTKVSRDTLIGYKHSSLPDYLGEKRAQGKILEKKKFPQYFETIEKHVNELTTWLDF